MLSEWIVRKCRDLQRNTTTQTFDIDQKCVKTLCWMENEAGNRSNQFDGTKAFKIVSRYALKIAIYERVISF